MTAQIHCWNCLYEFKPRKENRKVCPECGSPYWKKPSMKVRLSKAIEAYNFKPRWYTETRKWISKIPAKEIPIPIVTKKEGE